MIDPGEIRGMRTLWAACLLQGLQEARGAAVALGGCKKHAGASAMVRRQALGWVGSADFHAVCALAGVDGVAVLDRWSAERVTLPVSRRRPARGAGS